jgi:Ca-activated chloride channel family protein
MNTRSIPVFALLSILLQLSAFLTPASAGETRNPQRSLGWSEDIDLLATERERDLFSGLQGEAERQMFFQAFWQARDPFPQTDRNELREEWEGRLAQVRSQWRTLRDDRARAYLLRGEPTSRFEAKCPTSGAFEVWVYEPGFREKHRTVLVFLPGGGNARLWRPDAAPDLAAAAAEPCSNRERLSQEAKFIGWAGRDQYEALVERALARPRPREWVSTFRPVALDTPENAPRLDGGMEIEYAGLQWEKVVVRVLILVSPQSLQVSSLPAAAPSTGADAHEFSVAGQVLRNGEPIESFLYRLRGRPVEQGVPLAFERYLAPGRYTLRVRLEHLASGSVLTEDRQIEVPQLQTVALPRSMAPAPVPAGRPEAVPVAVPAPVPMTLKIASPAPEPAPPDVARVLAEADAALSVHRPGLRLVAPPGNVLTGNARFTVRLEQGPDSPARERIERVAFFLDGKPLLTRNNPPFDLAVDLGAVPRPRKLQAEGLGADGEVLARDEVLVNAGAQSFRVRLLEPRPGRGYRRSLRALAEVTPPAGAAVEKVEIWFGEDLLATLYQLPYTHPLLLPKEGEAGYVRAVAYLAGGGASEDLVFINTPVEPDSMDVHMVELYTTVLDGQGRPVTGGLEPGAFQVTENGVRQKIRQVDPVGDTPVRLVTLIDSSASMAPQMKSARQAALGFLRGLLRPRDQAAVIAFNRHPQVVVPLTGDFERLSEGLQGMLAEDDTALYDSLVYSLLYLTEAKGQRAVLLLSDGLDRSSRLGFEQALEAARGSGIAVYAIGLGLPSGAEGEAGQRLAQLAGVTGGRTFFADDASQLAGVYAEIERELRAQYRISYQSSNNQTDGSFRRVQVQVGKGGAEARTVSGYYP